MKKTIALLLSALLILTVFAACGKTETPEEKTSTDASYEYTHRDLPEAVYITPAEGFAGGTGTEADPYQISNAAELAFLEKQINASEEIISDYQKAYYVLTADIELNNTESFEEWSETAPEFSWKSINRTNTTLTLDGKGFTISGLYINADSEEDSAEYGLFGKFDGTIKNLNIDKSYISVSGNTSHVGTLVGYLSQGAVIENCNVNSVIECYDNTAGGIAGSVSGGFVMGEDYKYTDEIKFPVIKGCTFSGQINQIKEKSMNILGGIAGSGEVEIIDCTNKGFINFGGLDIAKAGGIIGMTGFGRISGCVNMGEIAGVIDAQQEAVSGAVAGGIVGDAFQSATGTTYMSRGLTIENCVNNGKVYTQYNAGGICGEIANDHNEWCLTVKDCENNGEVVALNNIGGIVGEMNCNGKNVNGDNVVIENCVNTANLTDATPGGIIGMFKLASGDAVIRNCKNSGSVTTAKEQNAGGIIAYWVAMNDIDARVKIENCENSGDIKSTHNAGGIIGWTGSDASMKTAASTAFEIKDCTNTGNISTENFNGFVGGIAANWGMENVKTTFSGCANSGTLQINAKEFDEETTESEVTFTLSRIVGGIVGRVGSGLFLTSDSDEEKENNINKEGAVITFDNCSNTGKYSVSDTESYEYEDGKAVYENFFGGIVGNTCAEKEFSIFVKDCTYSNFDRGLGNAELPDVGEKK